MNPNLARIFDGKKFMWDGKLYETEREVLQVQEAYRHDNFELQVVEEEGKFLVYSRRVVKEVVVTAP